MRKNTAGVLAGLAIGAIAVKLLSKRVSTNRAVDNMISDNPNLFSNTATVRPSLNNILQPQSRLPAGFGVLAAPPPTVNNVLLPTGQLRPGFGVLAPPPFFG